MEPTLNQLAELAGIGLCILTGCGGILTALGLSIKLGKILEKQEYTHTQLTELKDTVKTLGKRVDQLSDRRA